MRLSPSPVPEGRSEVGVLPALLGQACCKGCRLWSVGKVAAQSSRASSIPAKGRETAQSELPGAQPSPRDPSGFACPPPQKGRQERASCSDPSAKQGTFQHSTKQQTSSMGAEDGLFPAWHNSAANGVQLGQTPTALAPPFQLPAPQTRGTNCPGGVLVWGAVPAPAALLRSPCGTDLPTSVCTLLRGAVRKGDRVLTHHPPSLLVLRTQP